MKKLKIPFSVTALCLMITACGGGSNNINEDPVTRPDGSNSIGCTISSTSSSCFEFTMEYPIAGIQYTCSGDRVNTFATQVDQNIVKGGCDAKDTVTFFINAANNLRIDLGVVKLSDLGRVSLDTNPVHLTILDMARGLTGEPAKVLDINDPTTKVAISLVKIFQAIGSQKTDSNIVGDVQLVELDTDSLKDIEKITQSIDVDELRNGSYANILLPWIDVNQITDAQAFAMLKDLSNMTLGALYQADPPVIIEASEGLSGQAGTGIVKKTLIGTFFLLSDRQGFTQGYGIQWRGVPERTSETIAAGLGLITQTAPIRMYADAQTQFINPINKRLATIERFKFLNDLNETMFINQGVLLNDYAVAGSDVYYKHLMNVTNVPQIDLAKWTQASGIEQYTGGVDFVKVSPISYLDRQVFRSKKNVKVGEKYHFPMYATLTFRYENKDLSDTQLGIMIDEHGDIRTDIAVNATETDMSGQCGITNSSDIILEDNFGVKQYRIGTVGGTNYQPVQNDISISPRIILSGTQFGPLDGVFLGVTTSVKGPVGTSLINTQGVKINLANLINSSSTNTNSITLVKFNNAPAEWVNIFNLFKGIYIGANQKTYTPTALEIDQQKRLAGTVSIKLADCYQVNTK